MFRFIHSSDLHLGKRFGNFSGDLPSRLREARHTVIARLAQHAREQGTTTILLAGDLFDTETPAPDVLRQALTEMHQHAPIRWVILPGNHDSLQATQLWTRMRAEAPGNVVLALEPQTITLTTDVVLLPAPCTTRRPGRDLTDWMDGAATPEGAVRVGLAHGAVQSFSEEEVGSDVIAPDRAGRAGLAYLALGDWHGAVEIGPRTWYSGTPEPDRFKHAAPGCALLVDISGASAVPEITQLPTSIFSWRKLTLHLLSEEDPVQALDALLPESRHRRHTLVDITATGRSRLPHWTALAAAVETATPDFAFLQVGASDLISETDVTDLDLIDRAGALRETANALLSDANNEALSTADRDTARAALVRLYAYAQAVAS